MKYTLALSALHLLWTRYSPPHQYSGAWRAPSSPNCVPPQLLLVHYAPPPSLSHLCRPCKGKAAALVGRRLECDVVGVIGAPAWQIRGSAQYCFLHQWSSPVGRHSHCCRSALWLLSHSYLMSESVFFFPSVFLFLRKDITRSFLQSCITPTSSHNFSEEIMNVSRHGSHLMQKYQHRNS